MKNSLILEGKKYISARQAASVINYSQDYIGQLCRAGKLDCKMIGRSWFVTEESLLAHRNSAFEATQERVSKILKPKKEIVVENIVYDSPKSQLSYEAENICLLPELNKKIQVEAPVSVSNSLFYVDEKKAIIILVLGLVLTAGGFIYSLTSFPSNQKSISANTIYNFSSRIMNGVNKQSDRVANYLLGANPSSNTAAAGDAVTQPSEPGIVIAPSSSSLKIDEQEKDKIKNYFSDEITVHPDETGTSGVITPVFRTANAKDNKGFIYVLVPVKTKK